MQSQEEFVKFGYPIISMNLQIEYYEKSYP